MKLVTNLPKSFRKCLQEELAPSHKYNTLYGDAAFQQMSILLPNRFTILQPPLAALVLAGGLDDFVAV